MKPWQLWQDMAHESEQAARLAEDGGCPRSAASRYYYAAYQAATALLLYQGLIPPEGREGWTHLDTPTLLRDQVRTIRSRDSRCDVAARRVDLYRLRLRADYQGDEPVQADQLPEAGRDARYVLKVANDVLPKG